MKKKTIKKEKKQVKKEKKQVVEIHIYIHQNNFSGTGGGSGTFYSQCTCGKGNGITSAPCPVHPLSPPYVTTCQN